MDKINKENKKDIVCSFCGSADSDVNFLVEGDKAYICDVCIDKASEIVLEKLKDVSKKDKDNQTPEKIKLMLDNYIIDQESKILIPAQFSAIK